MKNNFYGLDVDFQRMDNLTKKTLQVLIHESNQWKTIKQTLMWKVFKNVDNIHLTVRVKGREGLLPGGLLLSETIDTESDLKDFVEDYLVWTRNHLF